MSMTRAQACYILASNEIMRTKNLDSKNKHLGEMRARAALAGCDGSAIPGELEQMAREIQSRSFGNVRFSSETFGNVLRLLRLYLKGFAVPEINIAPVP